MFSIIVINSGNRAKISFFKENVSFVKEMVSWTELLIPSETWLNYSNFFVLASTLQKPGLIS